MKVISWLALGLVGATLVPLSFALGAVAVLVGASSAGQGTPAAAGGTSSPTVVAPGPLGGIPLGYLEDFLVSGARFDVPWEVLAGIYRVECDFGRSLLAGCNPIGTENPAGAQGPGQFLPRTWRTSLGPFELIPPGPPTTSDAEGFATSASGSGVTDPWVPADAVASTARLLAADGAPDHLRRAIWSYDHSVAYVDEVLALARGYEAAVASRPTAETSATAARPAAGRLVAPRARPPRTRSARSVLPSKRGSVQPRTEDRMVRVTAEGARTSIHSSVEDPFDQASRATACQPARLCTSSSQAALAPATCTRWAPLSV